MLKAVPMAKVAVVGPKGRMASAIETLHDLRLLHVEDYQPGDDEAFDLGTPLEQGNVVSERLLRLRGVLKGAGLAAPTDARAFTPENLKALEERLQEVEDELARLVERRSETVDSLKAVAEEEELLNRVPGLPIRLDLLHGYKNVTVATGIIPPDADVEAIKQADPSAEIFTQAAPEGRFIAVFSRATAGRQVSERLAAMRYTPLELPDIPSTVPERLAELDRRDRELKGRQAEIEAKIKAIEERHAAALFALDEALTIEADKATAPVRFRTTKNSFMIEGWVPRHRFDALSDALAKVTDSKVFVTELDFTKAHAHADGPLGVDAHEPEGHVHVEEEDEPPVKLRNKGASGHYELITDTYSRPKYREIDPTSFIFYGFPFMYGFMLGDIAYAIMLMILIGTGVFSKVFDFFGFQSKKQLNRILLHSAIWSAIFGLLYAEFFGLELFGHEGILWGDHNQLNDGQGIFGTAHDAPLVGSLAWYPISRFVYVPQLLITTVIIGALHMLIGLGLGFRNALVAHGLKDALGHRGSWLGILGGLVLVGAGFGLPALGVTAAAPLLWVGVAFAAIGLVLLIRGEGFIGVMELPSIVSNLLSYTRLLAIGLSSAGIALAGNKVAVLLTGTGVLGWLAAIVVLLMFHGLNIALGVIGPSLHSLRLHYVEFFTKFYEGGGDPYEPFGFERKYTQKEVKTA